MTDFVIFPDDEAQVEFAPVKLDLPICVTCRQQPSHMAEIVDWLSDDTIICIHCDGGGATR